MIAPRVSILMPVYNARPYLRAAVESVLAQTHRDFEFVVVDDGSSDGSGDDLAAAAAADPRVVVVRLPGNRGYTRAMQAGLRQVRGEMIARMDADDVSEPGRLAAQVAFLDAHPDHVAVGTRVVFIDAGGAELERPDTPTDHAAIDAWHMSGRGSVLWHPSVVVRRAVFERVGGYRAEMEPAEDFDLWLRLAEVGQLAVLPDRLVRYRIHPRSVSRTRTAEQDRAVWRGLCSAVCRRRHPLAGVPFADLGEDEQVNWVDLALAAGRSADARRWAWRRVRERPSAARVKQFLKCCVLPACPALLPLYDRLRGRTRRASALDR